MPAGSLRAKLTAMSHRKGKRIGSDTKKKTKKPKKQIGEADKLLERDYNGINLFERYPNFAKLHVERLIMDENVEDEELEENLQIILGAIRFLNSLQFQASRINKEKLFRKFNHNFPQLVIVDQLYCIMAKTGSETFIDRNIEQLITLQKVKLIDLNNENFNFRLIILYEDFLKVVKDTFKDEKVMKRFINLIEDYPNLLQIDGALLKRYALDTTQLIHLGFLSISRERKGGDSEAVYNISLPNLGPFLKIVNKDEGTELDLVAECNGWFWAVGVLQYASRKGV
ncbi:hypothetical protein FOA43_001549 [Brettanomyces nanus]|uniref:Uncharacterized protein n=1 Tax=Eeniella nana TaxID=13502 RepID=A0A875S4R6_EENNA|nr:uncharacterized protein FOA43_001549 [Brettanomyces nanus]QPG74224.1 hypothetical protein FOA43_001549 [Brettanomyces nanus]